MEMGNITLQVWSWVDTNAIYVFGALIGLAVGAFYGFRRLARKHG
jgi:hypothetical protein